jgi:hypothetical protein
VKTLRRIQFKIAILTTIAILCNPKGVEEKSSIIKAGNKVSQSTWVVPIAIVSQIIIKNKKLKLTQG